MLRPLISLLPFALLACSGPVKTLPAASATPRSTGLTSDSLHLVSKQFVFTEGPAVDRQGNIFFTDQPRNQIWKYGTDGKLSLFLDSTGRSNGLYFDSRGQLIACADEHNELWSISQTGEKKIILKGPPGKAFNGPNDLWIDRNGGIYFTDPYYQRDYWTRKAAEISYQGLYYLPAGAGEAILLDSTMNRPNGIVGSADGKILYVSDIGAGRTYSYQIDAAGQLFGRKLFTEMGSDGMTIDRLGNLYLSGKGVTVYSPMGETILQIPVPSNWVGNICFGGAKRDLLFITASESVYVIRMKVGGIE